MGNKYTFFSSQLENRQMAGIDILSYEIDLTKALHGNMVSRRSVGQHKGTLLSF